MASAFPPNETHWLSILDGYVVSDEEQGGLNSSLDCRGYTC